MVRLARAMPLTLWKGGQIFDNHMITIFKNMKRSSLYLIYRLGYIYLRWKKIYKLYGRYEILWVNCAEKKTNSDMAGTVA